MMKEKLLEEEFVYVLNSIQVENYTYITTILSDHEPRVFGKN